MHWLQVVVGLPRQALSELFCAQMCVEGWEGACIVTNKSPGVCVASAECNWTIIGLDP